MRNICFIELAQYREFFIITNQHIIWEAEKEIDFVLTSIKCRSAVYRIFPDEDTNNLLTETGYMKAVNFSNKSEIMRVVGEFPFIG